MKQTIPTKYTYCPVEHVTAIAGSRWKLIIVYVLRERTMRFGQLHAIVGDISAKVLTNCLRELEADEVLVRHAISPSRVEYSLTEKGRELVPILVELVKWDKKFFPAAVEKVA
ncbi:transcriptional regulator, HxlR family [Chitinophaga jiangningensis]|uniref:Transcriptional regulator, HxlR family n=1 Tax=Chitinophaga jiangningensis TaxID=1419482 RepID=A0A1M7G6J7_9BACT|nr:helix-turn-helix domain-containing protein [Chitinophaga jiangningensis]SHM12014.1 transcriptional regulator, HxlR family [Chitinophaga jiangningensis]